MGLSYDVSDLVLFILHLLGQGQLHIDSLAHFNFNFQKTFSVSSHVTNRIHPKHSNCPTSNVNPIPVFI